MLAEFKTSFLSFLAIFFVQIPTLALSLELPQIKTWFGDVLEMRIPKETGFWHFPGGGNNLGPTLHDPEF